MTPSAKAGSPLAATTMARIAVLSTTTYSTPALAYGGETSFFHLAKGLCELGHDVTLYGAPGSLPPHENCRCRLKYIPGTYSEMSYAREWLIAEWHYQEIMANDYVLDCSLNHPVAEWAGWYGPPEHQRKTVVVLNGTTSHVPRCGLFNTVVGSNKWKELLLYGRTQFYSTPYEQTYGGSIEPVPEEAFLGVVPFWTDVNFYTPGDTKDDYLLFLSRPTAYKGLTQALELVAERKLHLKIVPGLGHASHTVELEQHRPQIEAAIARGAKVDVVSIPQNSQHHILKRELYRKARALLAPFQSHEPFGLVLIEALACGTPVICSRMGAFPEIIKQGETGYLCRTKAEYLEAIDHLGDLPAGAPRGDAESRWHYLRAATDYMKLLEK